MALTEIDLSKNTKDATLTPAKISTNIADNFTFPNNVTATNELKTPSIADLSAILVIDVANRYLKDSTNVITLDWLNRLLKASDGSTSINFNTPGTVDINTILDVTGHSIIHVATPVNANDASNKAYVDTVAQGLLTKAACTAATTGALVPVTAAGSGVGKTLTENANGLLTVDGVSTWIDVVNNGGSTNPADPNPASRVLVKDQVNPIDNGIYCVTNKGSAGVPFVLTRAIDFDGSPANEVAPGDFTFIGEGTVNASSGWTVSGSNNPIVVDTNPIPFIQFSGAGQIIAGNGLTKTGNQLDVHPLDASLTVHIGDISVTRDPAGALGLSGAGVAVNTDGTYIGISANNVTLLNPGQHTVAGANTQIQYNNLGNFGASANLTTDGTNLTLASGTVNANILKSTSGTLTLQNQANSNPGIILANAAGTSIMRINTASQNVAVGFGYAGSGATLDVNGSGKFVGGVLANDIFDLSSLEAIKVSSRQLYANDGSTVQMQWGTVGTVTMGAALDLNTHQIHNVVDPTVAQDAATKNYVDGGSHTVAGSNTQVQFNNAGAFGASSNLTWDNTNSNLLIGSTSSVSAHLEVSNNDNSLGVIVTTPDTGGDANGNSGPVNAGITITTGSAGGFARGGNLTLTTGNGHNPVGGSITLTTVSNPSIGGGNPVPGNITMTCGDYVSGPSAGDTTSGGTLTLTSGSTAGAGTANGGSITLTTGSSASGPVNGGSITLTTGTTSGTRTGGSITLTSNTPANGGNLSLTGTGASHGTITAGGNMTIDGTTFKVDSVNHRVGVGTSSPSQLFDIGGGHVTWNDSTATFTIFEPATSNTLVVGDFSASGIVSLPGFGQVRFGDVFNSANYVGIQAPHITSTYIIKLPVQQATASGQSLTNDGAGNTSWTTVTTPAAGANTQVQFNNSGVFGASANLTWNGTTLKSTALTTDVVNMASGTQVMDLLDRYLLGTTGNFSVAWGAQILANNSGAWSVIWGDQSIGGNTNRRLVDPNTTTAIDWTNRLMGDATGTNGNSGLIVGSGVGNAKLSIDWNNRLLVGPDGATTGLNWATAGQIILPGTDANNTLQLNQGGGATFTTQNSGGSVTGGNLTLTTGNITNPSGTAQGGSITLTTGQGGGGSGCFGGNITLTTFNNAGNGHGVAPTGGSVTLTCGSASTGTNDAGGNLTLTSFTPANGGNLVITGTASGKGQVTVGGSSPAGSASVDIQSTTRGFLPPRMTTTQKNAIATPATGLVVYDSTLNLLQLYNGTSWTSVGAVINFVTREVPSGTINGVNTVFTLANTPVVGSEEVFLNGLLQNVGALNDYTISGATITFNTAPDLGSVLLVTYRF